MNQKQAVENYIKEHGSITSFEAFMSLGITRLSAVIFEMKRAGIKILTDRITIENRYGNPTTYAVYRIKTDD